jgi:DNA-binding MarR family transcriptional regulator
MVTRSPTLGTLMRHLIDLLDGDVEAAYAMAGLDWRPRYTPVLWALMREGAVSIRALSRVIGITHSAVSQTVSQMQRDGLVELTAGVDARERIVALSGKAEAMIPALQRQWAATNAAADQLDAELSAPLSKIASEAIEALTLTPFGERIRRAAETLDLPNNP